MVTKLTKKSRAYEYRPCSSSDSTRSTTRVCVGVGKIDGWTIEGGIEIRVCIEGVEMGGCMDGEGYAGMKCYLRNEDCVDRKGCVGIEESRALEPWLCWC